MGHERVWEKNYCVGKVLSDLLASYAKRVSLLTHNLKESGDLNSYLPTKVENR